MAAQGKKQEKIVKTPGGSIVPENMAPPAIQQPASEPPVQAPPPQQQPPPTPPPAQQPAAQPSAPLNLPEEKEEEIPLEKKNNRIYITGIILSLIVLAATVGIFFYRLQQKEAESTEPVIEEVEVDEPEATEVEEEEIVEQLEREDITLEILNGSSVAGLAGDTADTFEELGYKIGDVGNADDTVGNQLYLSEEADEDSLEVLLDDVKEELGIKKVTGTLDDIEGTARIVLGSEE